MKQPNLFPPQQVPARPSAQPGSSGSPRSAPAPPAGDVVEPGEPRSGSPEAGSIPAVAADLDAASEVAEATGSRKTPCSAPLTAGPSSIVARIIALASQGILTDAEKGELDILLNRHLNTNSPKLLDKLYGEPPDGWGFPKRFIKQGARNTDRLARSVDALLASYRQKQDRRLELCLLLSDRLTQLESLNAKLDKDGRIRCSLNIAGTKVGRMASYASNAGSGFNLHTVSPRHRKLFVADVGYDFYSVDLKGADGWTIGAECAALGDRRMLDDLCAGLKPANAVVLLLLHGARVNSWTIGECLDAQSKLDKKDWRYLACKKGIWGTCYGLGDVALSEKILEEAWKEAGELVAISAADCKKLQAAIHVRYPGVKRRWERIKFLLQRDGKLEACGGQSRDFFGRKTDHATHKEGFAYAPAANTAYANHLALLKLWNDPENQDGEGKRIVQPLLPVHDSILFQAPVERRDWARQRIPVWFANPLTVAGTTFTIPFEALRGPSWGELRPL